MASVKHTTNQNDYIVLAIILAIIAIGFNIYNLLSTNTPGGKKINEVVGRYVFDSNYNCSSRSELGNYGWQNSNCIVATIASPQPPLAMGCEYTVHWTPFSTPQVPSISSPPSPASSQEVFTCNSIGPGSFGIIDVVWHNGMIELLGPRNFTPIPNGDSITVKYYGLY
jgi:hypothetical protein